MSRLPGRWSAAFASALLFALAGPLGADEKDRRLDIYFIDVEGGAATLLVTPTGESMLIDSGYPDNGGRDLGRILHVVRDVAGRKQIDHASVSHWHLDHFGNHAALAGVFKIRNFWDRGIPDRLEEDPKFGERIAAYRAASQNQSRTLTAGASFVMMSDPTPLEIKVVAASGEVIPNDGPANPYVAEHTPQPEDKSDNAKSVCIMYTFGKFKFLTCGDLTWNTEAKLVTPNNPLGQVDLFMVTHHGLDSSNNPVFVKAIDPRVTVMCNGPTKGGAKSTQETLRQVKSRLASFQLHRNIDLKDDEQTPAEFIANSGKTEDCKGVYIKASVAPDGKSYTVQIGDQGKVHNFESR